MRSSSWNENGQGKPNHSNTFTAHTGTTPHHYKTTQVNHLQNRKRLLEQDTRQQQDINTLTRKPGNNGRSPPPHIYMKHLKIKPINTTRYSTGNTRYTSTTGEDDME
jgi:hypothetical protein